MPTTNAGRSIKDSEAAYFRLVCFKKTNKEITPWIVFSGPDDLIQKYLSAPTISWKIYLVFGQHAVDFIPHKSPHK